MFVDLPERFCFRKSISRAGLPGLRARGRGDDEQSPVGGDGVMERDWFSLALKLSLTPNWRHHLLCFGGGLSKCRFQLNGVCV
jgi:hypothetical protein